MTKRFWFSTVCAMVALASATASADKIRLRSGKIVDASFLSADVRMVRALLPNGSVVELAVDDVSAIEFSARKAAPAPAPDPSKAPKPITVPSGSMLNVRLTQAIDVDSSKSGTTYKTLLDDPLMMNGQIVIPRGAAVMVQAVKVEQAGAMKGADKITLKANSIAFGGRTYDVVTTYVEAAGKGEGKKTARKVGGGAGLGAVVGGIAGGGTGAAIGAAVGATTGAIVASQGTEHLALPAETRLQFQLSAAVTVQP